MPSSRHNWWEGSSGHDWLFGADWLFDNTFEARDAAMSALRSLRHREKSYLYYTDANGNKVVRKVVNINFGPLGRAALVGDDPTEEAA